MLAIEIRFLVKRLVWPKLVPAHQIASQQQLDGVVQGGPAHSIVLVLHGEVERFDVEMIIAAVNLFENGIALRSLSLPVVFKITGEDFLHFFKF